MGLLPVLLLAAAAAHAPAGGPATGTPSADVSEQKANGDESDQQSETWPDPWTEDLGLEGMELGAACGLGICALGPHILLTVVTLGLWSGAMLPAAIGILITFVNNGWTRWNAAAMWPVVGAVLLSAAWTTVTWVGWAFFGSWFLAASDPNFGLAIFPPNSSITAQSLLPAVNVTFVMSQALTPLVATAGALVAYNVTSEVAADDTPTRWMPDGLFTSEDGEAHDGEAADGTIDAPTIAPPAIAPHPAVEPRAREGVIPPQRF